MKRSNQDQLQTILDHSPDLIFVHDQNGHITRVNSTACDRLGYDRDTLTDMNITDIEVHLDRAELESIWNESAEEDGTVHQGRHRCRDGSEYPVEIHLTRLPMDGENQVLALARDIRERTERELLIDQAQTAARLGAWRIDLDTDEIEWTEPVYDIFDVNPDREIDLETFMEMVHEDDRNRVEDHFDRALDGEHFDLKHRIRTPDGEVRWVQERGEVLFASGDEPNLGIGVVRDITEEKEMTSRLREFKRAVEAAGSAIYIADRDGTIQYVNSAFEELTGYDADNVVGKNPRILKSGLYDEAFYEDMWNQITAGKTWEQEMVNERSDGTKYVVNQTIAPIQEEDEVRRFVAVASDITERRRMERKLQNERDRLEELVHLQEELMDQNFDLETTQRTVLEKVQGLIKADGVNLWFKQGQRLVFGDGVGGYVVDDDTPRHLDDTLAGNSLQDGKPLACPDTSRDRCQGLSADEVPSGSIMYLPLSQGQEQFGVIEIIYQEPDQLENIPESVHQLIGGLISSSLFQALQQEEKRKYIERVENLATTDQLTELPNRRHLMSVLEDSIERAQRLHEDLCFAMLDLDHFKKVNDQFGHSVGDDVLKEFADVLRNETRSEDLPARYGGEEFALLLRQVDPDTAETIVSRVLKTFRSREFEALNETFQVTASAGLAPLEADDDCDTIIARADNALYDAKEAGRDRLVNADH